MNINLLQITVWIYMYAFQRLLGASDSARKITKSSLHGKGTSKEKYQFINVWTEAEMKKEDFFSSEGSFPQLFMLLTYSCKG